MKTLTMAFFGEGSTDHRFLPIIIKRTAIDILRQSGSSHVEVLDPISVGQGIRAQTQAEKILRAAEQAYGVHLLIVHLDADTRDPRVAYEERFLPGLEAVQQSTGQLCRTLIPIIPVKNMEAWLLCDVEAFQEAVGTRLQGHELGLPLHPHQVEALSDPKSVFRNAVTVAMTHRRRRGRIDPGKYYELLGHSIRLDRLQAVPAYQTFREDFTSLLARLRFIGY